MPQHGDTLRPRVIDINVWLALTWDRHPQHVPASEWYGSIDNAALIFAG